MTDILTKRRKENEASSFESWMRKRGTTEISAITPDKAATVRAKSAPTYGRTAEQLYESGLQSSGYARFLANEAERAFQNAKQTYGDALARAQEKNIRGYANYLTSHEAKQDSLRKQLIERIGRGESLNTEVAYHRALSAGLTDKNAREAAEMGIAVAKERTTTRLLTMILDNRLSHTRVEDYAISLGYTEDEAKRLAEYARLINNWRIPQSVPQKP